jgi:hypothetical protein
MLGLFNNQRLSRDCPQWTRRSGATPLPFAPDVAYQLADTPVAHVQVKDTLNLVSQRRGGCTQITLQFFHDPLGNRRRDLGRLATFASIHQAHPMASAFDVPTPQSRDMLGVIRQPQILTHGFHRFALLHPLDQLFLAQGEINLCLRKSFIHRLSSVLDTDSLSECLQNG